MLNLYQRHTNKCRHRHKGRDWIKCSCPIHVDGLLADGTRVRDSLKTRDWGRAKRKLADLEADGIAPPRKTLEDAVQAFLKQHADRTSETVRKYKRVLAYLTEFCGTKSISYLDAVNLEVLDGYALWRNKENWTWIKEIEILRQFCTFCIDRDWIVKNPAKRLRRPKMMEANHVVPFTQEEIVRIIFACDGIGRYSYERLRARAMVLLMRYAGLRVSDVVTLSRDHIQGKHLVKEAVKNHSKISVELHPDVLKALEALPRPKAAAKDCRFYFSSGNSSMRSLVKGAQRTLGVVFKRAKVAGAHPHKFRHTLASELLARARPSRISPVSSQTRRTPCAATTRSGLRNIRPGRTWSSASSMARICHRRKRRR